MQAGKLPLFIYVKKLCLVTFELLNVQTIKLNSVGYNDTANCKQLQSSRQLD